MDQRWQIGLVTQFQSVAVKKLSWSSNQNQPNTELTSKSGSSKSGSRSKDWNVQSIFGQKQRLYMHLLQRKLMFRLPHSIPRKSGLVLKFHESTHPSSAQISDFGANPDFRRIECGSWKIKFLCRSCIYNRYFWPNIDCTFESLDLDPDLLVMKHYNFLTWILCVTPVGWLQCWTP